MTFFVSVESLHKDVTNQLLPGSSKYGLDQLVGISKDLEHDIDAINSVIKISDTVNAHSKDLKYNIKFFPHLSDEFIFGKEDGENEVEIVENMFIVSRVNFADEEDCRLGQIAACSRPAGNPFEQMFKENDNHFSKETVSYPSILN